MKWKQNINTKRSSVSVIVFAAVAGLVLQMICCGVIALLLEKGSIGEEMIKIAAMIVQALGIAAATVVSWVGSNEEKLKATALASAIVLTVPVLAGLLLWRIDTAVFIAGVAVSLSVFGLLTWMMSRTKNRGVWPQQNRRYR